MKAFTSFMDGKKTYVGLLVTLFGVLGISRYISPEELEKTINLLIELVGIGIAVYGRSVAKSQ